MTYRTKAGFLFLIFLVFFAFTGFSQTDPEQYRKTLESADSYFAKGDYINAKASYQIAVRLAPDDQYAKDRLQQSLDMIKQQMFQNSLYTQKVQIADDLYKKNDFEGAIKMYEEALVILPGDSYASGKVQEINKNMADAKQLETDYQSSITKGDQAYKEGKLDVALAEFRKASTLKPAEAYPKDKTTEIGKLLADKTAITTDYDSLLQSADVAISHNKYDEAISSLEAAIKLKPGESQPKAKLEETRKQKAAWDSYSNIINEADNFYVSKDFEKAKEKYMQAQAIKPADEYPKRMLEKIDIALMDLSKANRSSYEVTIALADKLFNEQDYERAIIEYNNALRFKPEEEYAKQRISDINNALSLRKSQEEAYSQSIAKADELYKGGLYEESRDEYAQASGIKPLENYPKVKIDEINTLLSKLASQKGVYDNLIKGADRLFFSDEYVEARDQYRAALDIFPQEQYPKDQITMIDEILGTRDKYVKAVTKADQLMYDKKYDEAMLEFRNAAGLSPDEAYPQQKIKELETLMASRANNKKPADDQKRKVSDEDNAISDKDYQAALAEYQKEKVYEINPADTTAIAATSAADQQYAEIIATADSSLANGDYDKALVEYQAALKLKPGEVYAEAKISQVDGKMKEIAAKQAFDKQYTDVVSEADKSLLAKDYNKALTEYQAALNLKPAETYPQAKITEINGILGGIAAKEALDRQYADAISAADKSLQAKDYEKAKAGYQSALNLKPGEPYAQEKITEINSIFADIAAKEAKEQQYTDAIAAADKSLQAKDYQAAKDGYQAAQKLKPGETYAQGKIAEINTIIGEIAAKEALDKQFADAVITADKSMQAGDYKAALAEYQAANNLKPGEATVKAKITEVNNKLDEIAAKEALDKQYTDAITAGDKSLQAKDYQKALTEYQSALNLKPGETYAQGKITEINSVIGEIAAKEALDKQFADVVTSADKSLQAGDYKAALTGYQAANTLRPGDATVQAKITEVNGKLDEVAAKEALDMQFENAVISGDKSMLAGDFKAALAGYQAANNLKPGDPTVQAKITEVNSKLDEIAAKEALDMQFADAVTSADKSMQTGDYKAALGSYQAANTLKPGDATVQAKIAEVNGKLDEIAVKEALDKQYADVIASADKSMQAGDYKDALAGYQAANTLRPGDATVQAKITQVNGKLDEVAAKEALDKQFENAVISGDKSMLAGDFKAALAGYQAANNLKPGDPTVQAKITEVNSKLDEIAAKEALDKKYEDEILAADKLLQAKDYQKAITAYQSAEAMKPGETYPQGKITEINATLAEIAAKEALDKQYADAISAADKTLQVKDYQKAITEYQAALAIKPGETYAQAKINEINKTLGDIAAKEALDKQYTETIAAADNALQAKDYKAALAGYQSAQQLKPAESYTQGKITEVNKALEEIASKEALDKQYTDAIAAADAAFQAKDYQKATTGYQSALKLKPGEQYPQTKITEVNAALAEVAKQQEIVKKYNEAIAFADKHLADKDYDNAMLEYQTANSLKPDETYPLNKIKEVEGIKEEIKKQKELDTQYNKILADADDFVKKEQYEEARASYQEAQKLKPAEEFPAKQIIEINRKLDFIALEKDKAYQIAISKADNYFSQQNYDMAKLQYDRAIELKPNELYPLDKMKVVNEEIMKKRQLVQEDYDKNIADADKFYASKIYDNAIDSYRAASVLKPEEEYPKEMVRRIMKLLSERSIVQINKEPLLIANNTTHKFDFISVPVKDRKSNYIFFRARNVSKTDYKLIISFGKDQQKNGGIVVKVPAGEDLYEFVVRISAQYKWFSEDNNWITFYPEGGDLEVSLMQISYSD